MNKSKRAAIIAGNWKMNFINCMEFFEGLNGIKIADNVKVVVCVPFTCLHTANVDANKFGLSAAIGAQDVSAIDKGAYTGEISAEMLAHAGARYVIVGHSERRQYHGETDVDIAAKLRRALERDITPILCVGETLEQHQLDVTSEHIRTQIKSALTYFDEQDMTKIVIAYEPIWAIGTGETATPEDAQKVCAEIRGVLSEMFGADVSDAISILYGGSMNEKNAAELLAQPDIDGGLIGGASLIAEKFARIIELAGN